MTVFLEVDYSGYFEFRLWADKLEAGEMVTQECFDRHLLILAEGSIRYRIPEEDRKNSYHNVSVQLPIKGEIDCQNCIIQWRYVRVISPVAPVKTARAKWDAGPMNFSRNCATVPTSPSSRRLWPKRPKDSLFPHSHHEIFGSIFSIISQILF